MLIKCLPVGNLMANCYIVTDEESLLCAVIDPGDESNTILDYIEQNKLKPAAIFLTHGHFDHTGVAETVAEETGAPIYIHPEDKCDLSRPSMYKFCTNMETIPYTDGQVIEVGALKFRVLETPGHSPGSVTLRCEDALFTGDTLFKGSCGRTDLPGGDMEKILGSLRRLADIPGNLEVYPGHEEFSTLSVERAANEFVRYAKGS